MQEGRYSEFRFERKFLSSYLGDKELDMVVKTHPALFHEIYWERQVNNIYFDTPHLTYFFDNVVGKSDRRKVRIRWYGEDNGIIQKPVLEFKIKSGQLGRKASFDLAPFHLKDASGIDFFNKHFEASDLPVNVLEELRGLRPGLLNKYRRRYYRSSDHNFRFTIDFDLRYYSYSDLSITIGQGKRDHVNSILELKYDQEHDDQAPNITQHLPIRMSKSSKYVNGIDIIRNNLAV